MKFIYASELKKIFDVWGHFYNLNLSGSIFQCRSVLEIVKKGHDTNKTSPDLTVIMMNPGSSKPIDKNYKPKTFSKTSYHRIKKKEIIPTQPDIAQYQIMRIMLLNNWGFARILNLSDLRNGDSGEFQTEFINAQKLDKTNPHCITNKYRKIELNNYLKQENNKIIVAWGSISELKESADLVLKLRKEILGIINGELPNFKHASPRNPKDKLKWLNEIQHKIATDSIISYEI